MKKWGALFAVALTILAVPAFAEDVTKDHVRDEYLIGPEDVLEISVWKNPDLSGEALVRPDGRITMPLIGDVKATGLSPDDLRKIIIEKLGEYQRTVVVSVIVKEINSYRIFILGEVPKPGPYTLKRRTTLIQAIAMAGGFKEYASKNDVVVIRERIGDAPEEKIVIRFKDIVDADEDYDKNIVLKSGDTIFVP